MQSKYEKRWANCFDKYLSLIEFDDFQLAIAIVVPTNRLLQNASRLPALGVDLRFRCRDLGAPKIIISSDGTRLPNTNMLRLCQTISQNNI